MSYESAEKELKGKRVNIDLVEQDLRTFWFFKTKLIADLEILKKECEKCIFICETCESCEKRDLIRRIVTELNKNENISED